MATLLLILSIICYVGAIILLFRLQYLAPIISFIGLFFMSMSEYLPINTAMILGWLCMALLVSSATYMQPIGIQQQRRGMGYMTVGAVAGMAIGLVAFTTTSMPSLLNGFMILGVVVGTYIGFLMFTQTPSGRQVNLKSGNFYKYLLAKGFPTAITVMQIGISLAITVAINNQTYL